MLCLPGTPPKKSKLEQACFLELTSCHFALYSIQMYLCCRDIFSPEHQAGKDSGFDKDKLDSKIL
ncbi:MAG: hypothetical protein ABRQ38_16150 [Candidatus Eremiobacterota bacterium]